MRAACATAPRTRISARSTRPRARRRRCRRRGAAAARRRGARGHGAGRAARRRCRAVLIGTPANAPASAVAEADGPVPAVDRAARAPRRSPAREQRDGTHRRAATGSAAACPCRPRAPGRRPTSTAAASRSPRSPRRLRDDREPRREPGAGRAVEREHAAGAAAAAPRPRACRQRRRREHPRPPPACTAGRAGSSPGPVAGSLATTTIVRHRSAQHRAMSWTVRSVPRTVPVTFDRPTRGAVRDRDLLDAPAGASPRAAPSRAATRTAGHEGRARAGRRGAPRASGRGRVSADAGTPSHARAQAHGWRHAQVPRPRAGRRACARRARGRAARRRRAATTRDEIAPSSEPSQSMKHDDVGRRRRRRPAKHAAPNPRRGSSTTRRAERARDGGRAVGRAVVDDDRRSSRRNRREHAGDRGGFVEHGEDHVGHGTPRGGYGRSPTPTPMSDDVNRKRARLRTLRWTSCSPTGTSTRPRPRACAPTGTLARMAGARRVVRGRRRGADRGPRRSSSTARTFASRSRRSTRRSTGARAGVWSGRSRVGIAAVAWGPRLARACSLATPAGRIDGAGRGVGGRPRAARRRARSRRIRHAARTSTSLDVDRVGSPLAFLGGFVDHLTEYRIHVQGHPPGYVLAALGTRPRRPRLARRSSPTHGDRRRRARRSCGAGRGPRGRGRVEPPAPPHRSSRSAPLAIWVATSADAFYAGVGAWAVTLVVLASGRTDRRGGRHALVGGVAVRCHRVPLVRARAARVDPGRGRGRRRRFGPLVVAAVGCGDGVRALRRRRVLVVRRSRRDPDPVLRRRRVASPVPRVPVAESRVLRHRARPGPRGRARSPARSPRVAPRRRRARRPWRSPASAGCRRARSSGSGCRSRSGCSLPAAARRGLGRRPSRWLAAQVVFTIGLQTLVRSPW